MAKRNDRPAREGGAHRARFRKWQNLAAPPTRVLSTAVDERLAPLLEAHGFRRVDVWLEQPDLPVGGSEIQLERAGDDHIDSVTFGFDKYRSPRFQVHGARRRRSPELAFMRAANLVARPRQYYHFWGKPWWLPTRFWPGHRSERVIDVVGVKLPQLLAFLDDGVLGRNISRQDLQPPTGEPATP